MPQIVAIIATTHAVEKYGGRFRATRHDLEEMAAAIRAGEMGQTMHHDPTRPIKVIYSDVSVESTDDGEWRLVARYDMSDEDWTAYEAERLDAQAPGAMSYSRTVPFAVLGDGPPAILVAGEADTFSQDEILDAAASVGGDEAVAAAEYVEFAAGDGCNVVIVVSQNSSPLQIWGPAVVSGLIAPAVFGLWRAGKWITYRIRFKRSETDHMDCVIKTDDRELLSRALQDATELDAHWKAEARVVLFDQDQWIPPS